MATINLGSIKFKWQGAYNAGTAYTVDDVVSYQGSSYICILASTGNLPTNASYWEQMSQKGTDADLLSISGTVQGDIYYNNGSAIARLGAGTSGQVLQTNGTGANPSWGTVSSDYVKITTVNGTGSSSVIALDNLFTSTYKNYYFTLKYEPASNSQPEFRYQDSSNTELNDSNYIYGGWLHTHASGTNSLAASAGYQENRWYPRETTAASASRPSYYHGWLWDMNSTQYKYAFISGKCFDGTYHRSTVHHLYYDNSTALGGFRITASTGNLNTGTELVVYGIKV
jgi:hypothetical protein